jgi:uncharacterized protein YraI
VTKFFRTLVFLAIFTISLTPMVFAEPIGDNGIKLVHSEPVTSGAVLKEYYWATAKGPAKIFVLEVDLENPYIKVDTILGKGKVTERSNVSAMAKETGAVAAINGDFFNTQAEGAPIGPTVVNGDLITSPFNFGKVFAVGVTKDKQAFINDFHFFGKVTAPNGNSFDLAGLNKTIYTADDNTHSHKNRLFIYDHMWAGTSRGNDGVTIPTEILVHNNKVAKISSGEYINSTVPEGMYILRGSGEAANFLLNNFQIGDEINIEYSMLPERDWSMLVGGHSLLVNSGQPYPYTRDKSTLDGLRARTAAGISEDRSTLYLVGVEGRTSESVGLTLDDLTLFLVDIGVWQAVNLDGGGSTTLVTRPLGEKEVQRAFPTEQQWERMVVNAIGIYSTAPQGQLKDIVIKGKDKLVVGDTVDYTLRAYDEYYNPFDLSELDVEWSITNNLGTLTNNSFSATSPGKTTLTVKINGLTKELPLTIISKEEAQKEEMAKLIAKIGQGTITGSVVNVRSGPDLTFDVLTQVNLGTQLKILDQEGEWLQVQLTEENLGWVANWLMDYPQVPGLVTGKVVNVRKGPGTDQEVLTQVKKDDQITLLTKNKEWYKVALSDRSTGWIIDWLVKPILDK